LQYAPQPPLRQRRVVRRGGLIVALLVAVGAVVYWFPVLREHVVLQVLQRRCLSHSMSPDEVVFDPDPQLARIGRLKPGTRSVPTYWNDFYARLSPPGLKSDATLFLGRMKRPDGRERLVAIDATLILPPQSSPYYGLLLTARVIEPSGLLNRPRLVATSTGQFFSSGTPGEMTAANRDAQDTSHVTLFNGRVEAWLKSDDSVTFAPREEILVSGQSWVRDLTPPAPSSPASPPTEARPATRPSASPAAR
jgi:hypothetical protein